MGLAGSGGVRWTAGARLDPMNESEISTALEDAFLRGVPLSNDLYADVLAGHEAALKASLDADADDALLCVLADDGDVAMLLVDWTGTIHRNEDALEHVKAMWRDNFEVNVQKLVPIFVEFISQNNLGVAGIKWIPEEPTDK
jgi:hypothetical protein